jgi:PIN domain nuclease of toxin-antitoxin system
VGVGQAGKSSVESKEEEKVNGYLLDTHIWLWIMAGATEKVSKQFFAEVEDWQHRGIVFLSPITCWELGLLVEAGHLGLDAPIESLWERDTAEAAFHVAKLTGPILVASTRLPGDIHRDPSDRILVATARNYGLTLVTRDGKLLDYAKSGALKARKP